MLVNTTKRVLALRAVGIVVLLLQFTLIIPLILPSPLTGRAADEKVQSIPSFEGLIAYSGEDGNIWVLPGDGRLAFQVTKDASESHRYYAPRWSPEGDKLAFCLHLEDGNATDRLYFVRTDEWMQFLLTDDVYCREGALSTLDWSADGAWVTFARSLVYGDESGQLGWQVYHGLWSANVDTGEVKESIAPPGNNPLIMPDWSPDGRWLRFYEVAYIEGLGVLRTWHPESNTLVNWLESQEDLFPGLASWSPDSSQLAFDQVTYVGFRGAGLYISSADGSEVHKLFSNPDEAASQPLWSPDGANIAFQSTFYGRRDESYHKLLLVTPDGSELREIVRSQSPMVPVSWAPTSDGLLFASFGDEVIKLYLYTIPTDTYVQIGQTSEWFADWSNAFTQPATQEPSSWVVSGFSPNQNQLVYLDKHYTLALLAPDTGMSAPLTPPFSATQFWTSPSGRRIVYRNQLLALEAQENGDLQVLYSTLPALPISGQVSWAPGEGRLSIQDKLGRVWLVDLDGNYVEIPGATSLPDWSHDGQWLSYCIGDSLWIVGPGVAPHRVGEGVNCPALWSPAKNLLVFNVGQTNLPNDQRGYVYDPLTDTTSRMPVDGAAKSWSPDGLLLAVQRTEGSSASGGSNIIFIVDPDSENYLQLAPFHTKDPSQQEWFAAPEGYLFGAYQFDASLKSAERVAEAVFDVSSNGQVLLVGIPNSKAGMDVLCQNGEVINPTPLLHMELADIRAAAAPGVRGWLSPEGDWVEIYAYKDEIIQHALTRCDGSQKINLGQDSFPEPGVFSSDGKWFIQRHSVLKEEAGESTGTDRHLIEIVLYELETGSAKKVPIINDSQVTWLHPFEPIGPILYALTGRVTEADGKPMPLVQILVNNAPAAVTDAEGIFRLEGLEAGIYTITGQLAGQVISPAEQVVHLPQERITMRFTVYPAPTDTPGSTTSSVSGGTVNPPATQVPPILVEPSLEVNLPLLAVITCGTFLGVLLLLGTLIYWRRRIVEPKMPQAKVVTPAQSGIPAAAPPQDQINTWLKEGVDLARQGLYEQSMQLLRRVIRADPGRAAGWLWLGWVTAQKGDYAKAERFFQRARQLGHPRAENALLWLKSKLR